MNTFKSLGLAVLSVSALHASAASSSIPAAYFRVVSADGKQESYLLGTIHEAVDFKEFPGDVIKQIGLSKSVSVERVMSADDLAAYAKDPITAMSKLAVMSGKPVDNATQLKLIQYGIPAGVAAHLSDQECGVLGVISEVESHDMPLDLKVMQAAYDAKIPLQALDSDSDRKSAVQKQAASDGGCSLKKLFTDHSVDDLRAYFNGMAKTEITAYRNGQLDSEANLDSPLVVARNRAWIASVVKSVKQGDAFIAVGQDHLYGKNGLIKLLTRLGYTVQAVGGETAK